MAHKNNPRLLLITLCITIFITSVKSRDPTSKASHFGRLLTGLDPALKKICDKTDNPNLCLSRLGPLVHGKPTADSVLDASFKAGIAAAKEALAEVQAAAKKSSPDQRSIISDCTEFYETAVENFDKSAAAKSSKDVGTMQTDLSAIMTFLDTCEDEFEEAGKPSPFKALGEKITQMASDSLAIANQLQ